MTITIDLPPEVADALTHKAAQEGRDVAGYVRQLVVSDADGNPAAQETPAPRTPGLHAGQYRIAENFDAPLPDSFWLGTDAGDGQAGQDDG